MEKIVKAIEFVDKAIGEIVDLTLRADGTVLITADHGNAEEKLTYPVGTFFFTSSAGTINTEHSNSPVPLMVIDQRFKGKKDILMEGNLADVAPTVLTLMGLPIPKSMTGRSLLKIERVADNTLYQ
jgi:2,3-bisphosphoglycerate-independent phosphoglycerate mutase